MTFRIYLKPHEINGKEDIRMFYKWYALLQVYVQVQFQITDSLMDIFSLE